MSESPRRPAFRPRATHTPEKYQLIAYQTRHALIDMVVKEGVSIYRAGRLLGINNSTAKVIVRQFREKGVIFKRRGERGKSEAELLGKPDPVPPRNDTPPPPVPAPTASPCGQLDTQPEPAVQNPLSAAQFLPMPYLLVFTWI